MNRNIPCLTRIIAIITILFSFNLVFSAEISRLVTNAPSSADGERTIPPGKSIMGFLTMEGRFDLEAARHSGCQGPLEMSGFESTFDSSTCQPLFRVASPAASADHPDDIYRATAFLRRLPA